MARVTADTRDDDRVVASVEAPAPTAPTLTDPGAWYANTADTDRYDLPGGHWLELKRELDAGDDAQIALRYAKRVRLEGDDSIFEPDLEAMRFARIIVWVVDWSFRHPTNSGAKAPIDPSTIKAMRGEAVNVLTEVIEFHKARYAVQTLNPTTGS